MSLAALRPTNEDEERRKFLTLLAAGERYEPQFTYQDMQKACLVRESCDRFLSDTLGSAAIAILRGVLKDYGSEEKYCASVWGPVLSREAVQGACEKYAAANGLTGKIRFRWSPGTLVTSCTGSNVNLVTRPEYYREVPTAKYCQRHAAPNPEASPHPRGSQTRPTVLPVKRAPCV